MRLKLVYLAIAITLCFAVNLVAQASEQSGVIKTTKGIIVVWNEPGNCYTIEIKGETIAPVPNEPLWFVVDGRVYQIVTVEKNKFLKPADQRGLDNRSILTRHRDWEADYISQTLGTKIKVDWSWPKLPNGLDALAWNFTLPEIAGKQNAKKQIYLSVVKRDHVLLLIGTAERTDDEAPIRASLIEAMNSLRSTDKPRSLKDVQAEVMKN